ncbi:enoyl-CoA hydratase/isomerase family protein [Sansalvadorimonas verongulae]|uniref:enoyl-CoA hydratase/isomerase family protein n=1 Tax=Sansalvadorimonas verongulae TaxID=2172824 RepID=UPI0012BB95C6|nr:enoyl-CoA hydratase/isomerase family protein [Sansalvadorimonas verongulae]MTI15442.1 enoyl-CoA hydratase/isomerase family protein [Sansalvadorimonas verongulae]
MSLPDCSTLLLSRQGPALVITFNRPEVRNALSLSTVQELLSVFDAASINPKIRAIVLRGSGGHFCAGGDIKDMAAARANLNKDDSDPFYELNRTFGQLLEAAEQLPQVVICVLEGTVMGGGFGLACISDIALAHKDARFALPETGLGIPPAQIAPFVVKRIGLTKARRLALLGEKFNGEESVVLGVSHEVYDTTEALDAALVDILTKVQRCAPGANAVTKKLMLSVQEKPMKELLDGAARDFSAAIQGPEGQEGTMAFMQKRLPAWAEPETEADG